MGCDLAGQALARASTPPVVIVGPAWVCKGSVARYRALAAAGAGTEAVTGSDGTFRTAAEMHRRLGADVLLARTLGEWGHGLAGHDPLRGAQLVRESAESAHRLGLDDSRPKVEPLSTRAS